MVTLDDTVVLAAEAFTGMVLFTIDEFVTHTVVFIWLGGTGVTLPSVKVETISQGIFRTSTRPFSLTFIVQTAEFCGE